jgi:dTDP-4-amino-4,6-dideoxygalactose transaminase
VIAVNAPMLGAEEEALLLEVVRSGRLVKGPMVDRFEDALRREVGTKHALALNSGTSALVAAMMAHGIRPGDEVITSPFTFVATLNAILHTGATPRFVDVGDDFTIDPAQVERALSSRTRAVVPVHLYGLPADMPRVLEACNGRDVLIVEDAAQALGASIGGRAAGAFGTGCFSFYATKNITTGEGGIVTTDDDDTADAVRILRDQGQRGVYEYVRPGFNFRMTELQAALGVAQMRRLQSINEARQANAAALVQGLGGLEGLVLPFVPPGRTHVFHQFTVRVTSDAKIGRDELRRNLSTFGIDSGVYYPRPVYEYECFRADPRVGNPETPRAARVAKEVLSLPVHPGLGPADLDRIVEGVRGCLA